MPMDELLLLLARKKAHIAPLRMTTAELGSLLGMSQQNASRRLSELESRGLAERTKKGIALTKKGISESHSLYSELKSVFEAEPLSLSGTITSGLGEGRYYMSLSGYKSQIRKKLGFSPFEGTLNVKLAPQEAAKKSSFLKSAEPAIIKGFSQGERTFGELYAYPCTIEGMKCALIVPLRTHHPSEIIEIISAASLKKTLGKRDGDKVRIELG
ncbi:Riboflavin kinase [uncultured archaeon]|nr:Riboflavin kinase [uncultured archaeon]